MKTIQDIPVGQMFYWIQGRYKWVCVRINNGLEGYEYYPIQSQSSGIGRTMTPPLELGGESTYGYITLDLTYFLDTVQKDLSLYSVTDLKSLLSRMDLMEAHGY